MQDADLMFTQWPIVYLKTNLELSRKEAFIRKKIVWNLDINNQQANID